MLYLQETVVVLVPDALLRFVVRHIRVLHVRILALLSSALPRQHPIVLSQGNETSVALAIFDTPEARVLIM